MSSKHPSAFAEAMGGAIGAFWTTLLFYPIDVAKIRLQAEADVHEDEEEGRGGGGGGPAEGESDEVEAGKEKASPSTPKLLIPRTPKTKTFLGEILIMLKEPDLWYAGLGTKLQLAVISTFVYFYVYTTFKRAYSRILKKPVSLLPNLLLASLAGIANVLVTMPLDVIVTRLQVASRGHRHSFMEMARIIYAEGITRFWQGLVPAMILTSNPAINYAAYDFLKALVPIGQGRKRHDTRQIFLIGMLSKFIATLITYPLIRAKVIMMAGTKEKEMLIDRSASSAMMMDEDDKTAAGGGGTSAADQASLLHQQGKEEHQDHHVTGPGLIETMSQLVKEGGVPALYVGLDAQVFNTALKSGVLLNTKEHVSRITSFLVRRILGTR